MIKLSKKKTQSRWIEIDNIKLEVDYPTNEQEAELNEILINASLDKEVRNLRYARYYLKYVIKNWEGIDEPCYVVNNELEKELWLSLTKDAVQTLTIFGKVFEELQFTEADKKKS